MKLSSAIFAMALLLSTVLAAEPSDAEIKSFISFISQIAKAHQIYADYVQEVKKINVKETDKFLSLVQFPFTYRTSQYGEETVKTFSSAQELLDARLTLTDLGGDFIEPISKFGEDVDKFKSENASISRRLGYDKKKNEYYYLKSHNGPASDSFELTFKIINGTFKLVQVSLEEF